MENSLSQIISPPISRHFTVSGDNKHSALELLFDKTSLPKKQLKQCAQNGAVWISRKTHSKPERLRRLKKILTEQQCLEFYFNPELMDQLVAAPQLIYDMGGYSVWLKPRGMLSQGSKWADHTALYRWVEMNYKPNNNPRQSWIVHRLDRATCGLMLLAHTKTIAATFSQLFEDNQVHKSYKAIVWGEFPEHKQKLNNPIDDKNAVSFVTLLGYDSELNLSLVEVEIETGRKHQIRIHLSQFGFPILGDRLYGNPQRDEKLNTTLDDKIDLQLTAFKLCFSCPVEQISKAFELQDEQLNLINLDITNSKPS